MSVKGKRVGFIGGGNMGEALIKGLLGASLVPAGPDHRHRRARRPARASSPGNSGSPPTATTPAASREADVVILAVKPQIMSDGPARDRAGRRPLSTC